MIPGDMFLCVQTGKLLVDVYVFHCLKGNYRNLFNAICLTCFATLDGILNLVLTGL